MVYLQRAVNGSWVTVSHAGYPLTGTKTVTFTKEYNHSTLYATTPYRFLLVNPNRTAEADELVLNTMLLDVRYSAF